MTGEGTAPDIVNLDELLAFRETTERITGFLTKRLKEHLATLSPLLAAGRVLGKHVGAREAAPRADEAFAELAEKYKQVAKFPFDLKPELDPEVVSAVRSGIQIYPYEYSYEAHGAKGSKRISMTSPIRWVVTYGSELSLAQMRDLLLGPGEHRSLPLLQAVVSALTFQVVLGRNANVAQVLKDLRYDIEVQALPDLEKLPLAVISVALPSFRPTDDMLLTAVNLSGVSAFIELIDTATVRSLVDPLRMQVESLLQE